MARKVRDYLSVASGLFQQRVQQLNREGWSVQLTEMFERLEETVGGPHDSEVAAALASPDLSEVGRQRAIAKAKTTALENQGKIADQYVAPLRARIKEKQEELDRRVSSPEPKTDAERIILEMRRREVRDDFRKIADPLARLNAYHASLGDPIVREALETSPPIMHVPTKADERSGNPALMLPHLVPMLPPEHVAMVRQNRIRNVAPEEADLLDDLISMAELHTQILATVQEIVQADMPSPSVLPKAPPAPAPRKSTGDPMKDGGFVIASQSMEGHFGE